MVFRHPVDQKGRWEYQITGVSKENTYRPVFEFYVSPPITSKVRSH